MFCHDQLFWAALVRLWLVAMQPAGCGRKEVRVGGGVTGRILRRAWCRAVPAHGMAHGVHACKPAGHTYAWHRDSDMLVCMIPSQAAQRTKQRSKPSSAAAATHPMLGRGGKDWLCKELGGHGRQSTDIKHSKRIALARLAGPVAHRRRARMHAQHACCACGSGR